MASYFSTTENHGFTYPEAQRNVDSGFLNNCKALSNLDDYIGNNLQPTERFNSMTRKNIDTIVGMFHSAHFPRSVSRVIKGGSLGKGTHLVGKSDIDLIVLLDGFRSQKEFLDQIDTLKTQTLHVLRSSDLLQVVKETNVGYQIWIRTDDFSEFIEGDVLLAVDHLKRFNENKSALYSEILASSSSAVMSFDDWVYSYSYSLDKLHVDFVQHDEMNIPRSPKLKNLIRLVKNWKDTYLQGVRRPPVAFVLELLTIYAWQQAGKPEARRFNTRKAFRDIMKMLVDYRNICGFWEDNYQLNVSSGIIDLSVRPLLLDPAIPYRDMAKGVNWEGTAQVAKKSLESPLLNDIRYESGWI